jgi:hypothetical protein
VAMALVYAFLALPVGIGATQRTKVLAGEVTHWPSSAVIYELSPARGLAMRLVREHPDSLLLASRLSNFSWDPKVDRSTDRLVVRDHPSPAYQRTRTNCHCHF